MKITGENVIAAEPSVVWAGLNDPETLKQSIPGCESLEQTADNQFKATVVTKIGPISARFNGNVELSDLDPPNGYTLSGSGSAGPMGNAKGKARVVLSPVDGGTELAYEIDADVTGKIAQLGARLIKSTAGVLAGQFFKNFGEIVAGPSEAAEAKDATSKNDSAWTWKVILIGIVLGFLIAAYNFFV